MIRARLAVAVALVAWATAASACGYCVEDRIAAVYDHALSMRAMGGKLQVAYFAWDGPVARGNAMREAIVSVVQRIDGVSRDSVRVSMEPAAIAVVFDPARMKREQLDTSIRKRLAALKLDVTPLQAAAATARP